MDAHLTSGHPGWFVPPDARNQGTLAELLRLQHGVVHRVQLAEHGITDEQLSWCVESGRWQRIHRGVVATFTGPLTYDAWVWAAIVRAGPGAVASHHTAAYLDGVADDPGPVVHITVPADRRVRGRIEGVRIHYAHRLGRTRHPTRFPPRTRPEETVLDIVDTIRRARDVETWVTRLCQRRVSTPERLAAALGLRKKIKWRPMLESMLSDVADGAESPLELRHMRRVERGHGLPVGTRQRRVAGGRVIWVDVDHDEFALRIELDGRVGHVEDGRFRDRRRDNVATVDGRATLRYGHADIFGGPCAVAAEQARVLAMRGWRGRARPCGPDCSLPMIMNTLPGDSTAKCS
ncbi:type IV toxin-antitoxin system AbiEi family antitoxin domain-containing protein [Phytoactinopolyspora limicola]|uniref:type IV toxin-antitoxin system AbiEi family antitoxin domain-containing protein n=1 Tax=Phytoactinopolyspora limicola TaxID=2715536 RepID=UPI001A9C3C97|nr:type IV toxin-antitoxin system AbiEi family antitoxin domain-containing protein [Phytoactinopolyspora limicola]